MTSHLRPGVESDSPAIIDRIMITSEASPAADHEIYDCCQSMRKAHAKVLHNLTEQQDFRVRPAVKLHRLLACCMLGVPSMKLTNFCTMPKLIDNLRQDVPRRSHAACLHKLLHLADLFLKHRPYRTCCNAVSAFPEVNGPDMCMSMPPGIEYHN